MIKTGQTWIGNNDETYYLTIEWVTPSGNIALCIDSFKEAIVISIYELKKEFILK